MSIDIASGRLELEGEDIAIPGHIPLVWDRRYSTALLSLLPTSLGAGWTSRYFATLTYVEGRFELFTPKGGVEFFDNPDGRFARGEVIRQLGAFKELFREGRCAVVRSWDVESGEIRRFVFLGSEPGAAWRLTSIEDVTATQAVDLTWGPEGRLASIRQRLEGRTLVPHYNRTGLIDHVNLLAVDGTAQRVVSYDYDELGRLTEVTNAAGFSDRFEYDPLGRIVREVIKDGGVFHNRYDTQGRCVLSTGLAHYHEKRLRFMDAIRATEVSNSYGEKTLYRFLPTGQAVSVVDPLGGESTTSYDEHGRIVAETDATGANTRYTYDAQGNRNSVTDALGQQTRFAYDDHHQAVSMVDAAGNKWMRAYDEQHRLVATMDPLDSRWRFVYDANGNVSEVVNPKGDCKRQTFQQGVLQSATDWMGHATHFKFDTFGRVVERTGPMQEVTRFRYDVMGNPIHVQLPDSAQLTATYDHAGNLTRFIDGDGHATRWRYGPCTRLLECVDPVGGSVRYVWGSERGRLDAVINERGERYTFERDEVGRIVREISFDGAVRRFRLDGKGYSVAYTNANEETIAITRDPLHRMIGQSLPDGEQVVYGYDLLGNLIKAVNSDMSVVIERDALGRITKEIQGDEWVASRYDSVGNLIATTTSLGHDAHYEHDANGEQTAIVTAGGKRIEFERDANGQEVTRRMPGGGRMTQRFDVMGRLIEQRVTRDGTEVQPSFDGVASAAELVRRDYTYDRSGALTRIVDGRWGQVDYVYDPAERLLSSIWQRGSTGAGKLGGPSEQFEYDPAGNLSRMRTQGSREADDNLEYGPGNRLLRKGSTRYEYDAEGRRVRKIEDGVESTPKVWTYEWNALDRLRRITRPDGEVWAYRYDALARRVSKERVGETDRAASSPNPPPPAEQFIWDRDVVTHHRCVGRDDATWLFEPTSFAPLAKVVAQSLQVLVNDHLGTPRELVSEAGAVLARAAGGAWEGGERIEACPVGFQGQWGDTESTELFSLFRCYDPEASSFTSQDSLRTRAGLNFCAYIGNVGNPISSVDPLGLAGCVELDKRVKDIAERHGGVALPDGGFKMPSKRAAKQAASEIAGNLGPAPETVRRKDYRDVRNTYKDDASNRLIGKVASDGSAGHYDHSIGHVFGSKDPAQQAHDARPHINAWNADHGSSSRDSTHLYY